MCVCVAYLENRYVYIYINIYITYVYRLYVITHMKHSHHTKGNELCLNQRFKRVLKYIF